MINLKKNFLIYGYGISGKSVEKYFINKNCNYNIYDDHKILSHKKVISKKHLLNKINEYDYFVVSPSIKIEKSHFLYEHKNKILIDLDFLSLEISSQKIIGITGTEGKSSTCNYLSEILSKKYNTKIIGNFGITILDKKNLKHYLSKIDILIIELSSFQLDKLKSLKFHYALITNIFSDHLDYHRNNRNYVKSKFRIQNFLFEDSYFFLSRKIYSRYRKLIRFNKKRIILNTDKVPFTKDLNSHIKKLNLNSIKKLINIIDPKMNIKNFEFKNTLIFRNQLIYATNNLKVYNDSKCTNLHNAIHKNKLINSFQKILILGGKLKKQDVNYKFNVTNTLVLIFGQHSDLFNNHLNFVNSNFFKFNNLDILIDFLKLIIKTHKCEYVLFSPGGESYDVYRDYLDRGKHFNQLIKKVLF